MPKHRVISFLPSATEILVLIEQEARLVTAHTVYDGMLIGRSHECDFPKYIRHLPVLTASRLSSHADSIEIHRQVQQSLLNNEPLFTIKKSLIETLKPDIILTQNLCDVCSIDLCSVKKIIINMIPQPRIVNLEPTSLAGVFESIMKIGDAISQSEAAKRIKDNLQSRLSAAVEVAQYHLNGSEGARSSIELLEWLNPIFPGGHWTAEMLQLSHAVTNLNLPNDISKQISSDRVIAADPEYLIIAPCGLSLDKTRKEMNKFVKENQWIHNLKCARLDKIYLVDGNEHFNRPGPRLVDAFEFLVGILYDSKLIPNNFPYEKYVLGRALTIQRQGCAGRGDTNFSSSVNMEIESCHFAACAAKKLMYEDPLSHLFVMTEYALLNRGTCCGNGCRHCPYGHFNVVENKGNKKRVNSITKVTFLKIPREDLDELSSDEHLVSCHPIEVTQHILFWTGGKDSLLALIYLLETCPGVRVILLTTFDSESSVLPHENLPIHTIMNQSRHLKLDLIAVPLLTGSQNDIYLSRVQEGIAIARECICKAYRDRDIPLPVVNIVLVFGDLRLLDIKTWREDMFTSAENRLSCLFPLFDIPYEILMAKLAEFSSNKYQHNIPSSSDQNFRLSQLQYSCIRVSSVGDKLRDNNIVCIGDEFNQKLVTGLMDAGIDVDVMGEDGSFHTVVYF